MSTSRFDTTEGATRRMRLRRVTGERKIPATLQASSREAPMNRFVASGIAIAIVMTLCSMTAHADVVTDWNQTTLEVLKAGNMVGNPWSRAMAMVHVAMSDAINSVQGRYRGYVSAAPAAPNASAEAAAVSAARQILLQLVPAQRTKIDEAYADSLSRIPDGSAKNDGITLGEQVAAVVQSDRATDATNAPDTYRPITSPRSLGADTATALPAICAGQTVGDEERRPVPSWPPAVIDYRGLRS